MARYQERFPGKSQAFLIRSAAGSDAEKLIAYMVQVNQETTFLSMEPGEFEASYPWRKRRPIWTPSPKAKTASC